MQLVREKEKFKVSEIPFWFWYRANAERTWSDDRQLVAGPSMVPSNLSDVAPMDSKQRNVRSDL